MHDLDRAAQDNLYAQCVLDLTLRGDLEWDEHERELARCVTVYGAYSVELSRNLSISPTAYYLSFSSSAHGFGVQPRDRALAESLWEAVEQQIKERQHDATERERERVLVQLLHDVNPAA